MTPPVQNKQIKAIASAVRAATFASDDLLNEGCRGIQATLKVTACDAASTGIKLRIRGKDPTSGAYYILNATPTAVTAVGTYVYEVRPGSSGTPASGGDITQTTEGQVPRTYNIQVVHSDGKNFTYTVGVQLLL